jgi:hypothetical protein
MVQHTDTGLGSRPLMRLRRNSAVEFSVHALYRPTSSCRRLIAGNRL